MTIAADPRVEVGSRWYVWGKHFTVQTVDDDRGGLGRRMVLLVPDGRKPHPFDWLPEKALLRVGRRSVA